MIKDLITPLNIEIVNKGNKSNSFVPYRENQNFELLPNGKISFICDKSEKALYYSNQLSKDLEVNLGDSTLVTKTGSYDLSSSTFNAGASFISVLKETTEAVEDEVKTVTEKFEVLGTLPYSAATPAIGMPAGNRFTVQFSYPGITELLNGKIANVTIEGGTSIDYTKSAFEDDLSLVTIVNATAATKLTVTIKWKANYIAVYEFTFKDIKLGQVNEIIADLQDIEISENQVVTLGNISTREVGFIPFKENFQVNIASGDSVALQTKVSEEVMYYLLQANKDLEVSL